MVTTYVSHWTWPLSPVIQSGGFVNQPPPLSSSLCSISAAVLSHVLKYNPESTVCVLSGVLHSQTELCNSGKLYKVALAAAFHRLLWVCQGKPQKCGSHVIKLSTRNVCLNLCYPCGWLKLRLAGWHCTAESWTRSKALSLQSCIVLTMPEALRCPTVLNTLPHSNELEGLCFFTQHATLNATLHHVHKGIILWLCSFNYWDNEIPSRKYLWRDGLCVWKTLK